jgi:hypothetical protein
MSDTGFGRHLDDPDELFMWLHAAVMAIATINLANRTGITARLLRGPAPLEELAREARLPQDKLARVLDFLQAHGVIGRDAAGDYRANGRTHRLEEAAGFFANAETTSTAASQLIPALREGRTAFELQFGLPVFEYLAERPERAALFGSFMGFMTRRDTRFLFAQHHFAPFVTVADLGGSMGDLLLAVLQEYPGTRGILFDLPGTIELARPVVEASPLSARVELCGGSFFESVPVADLYLLKQILHDWDDAECRAILACIRSAIPAHGRLVAIEHVLQEEPVPDEGQGTDIAMLIWATGRERRLAEYEALFRTSGFAIERVSRNPRGHSVIEAVPIVRCRPRAVT